MPASTIRGDVRRELNSVVHRLNHPFVAYALIAALQLKVVWSDWMFRDLPTGDPAGYFAGARLWVEREQVSFEWSPLYIALYGTLFSSVGDVYATYLLHRLLIVVAASLLVLAAMRQLLPTSTAWFVAAWWTLLESAFNVAVEVHLFVVLPVLLAVVLASKLPCTIGRAVAFAILGGSAILIRNELAISAIVFGGLCVAWESKRLLASPDRLRSLVTRRIVAYAVPLVVTTALVALVYAHAIVKLPELITYVQGRLTYATCQIYAVGYQQRYSDWQLNRWLECQDLMRRQFGQPTPSFLEALRSNPRAMLRHVVWNLELLPGALQVSLFNAMSGRATPDFVEVPRNTTVVPMFSIAALLVVAVGIWLFASRHGEWARRSVEGRLWGWLVLLATVGGTLVVAVVQRPRPAYIYPITIFLMALVGLSAALVVSRLPGSRGQRALMPLAMFGMLVLAPRYYDDPLHVRPRPVLAQYESLKPYAELIQDPSTVFLTGDYAHEIAIFLGAHPSQARSYAILDEYQGAEGLGSFLADRGVTVFYVDNGMNERLRAMEAARPLLSDPSSVGWVLIGRQNLSERSWLLVGRPTAR